MRAAIGVTAVFAALWLAGHAAAGPGLIVGVDDDTTKWLGRPNGLVAVSDDLGLGAVRVMVPWRPSERTPSRRQQVFLHRIALRIALGDRVVLALYGRAAQAPVSEKARETYCGFLAHVLARIPDLNDVVIWNEANNPYFWPASAGAPAYERLLARCWDQLHGLRRNVDVIDSTAPHEDPGVFLRRLGAAYRASHRPRPILDTYGHNAYPDSAMEPPSARHTNGSIDEGDYLLLMRVLSRAFGGTRQPLPGQGRTRIWYLEDGFQTAVPRSKAWLYHGQETARALLPAADSGAAPPDQATQLRQAIDLAYCQPAVGAFFNFQLFDDHDLRGWQSGVLWPDGTPKPAYAALRDEIARVRQGAPSCS